MAAAMGQAPFLQAGQSGWPEDRSDEFHAAALATGHQHWRRT